MSKYIHVNASDKFTGTRMPGIGQQPLRLDTKLQLRSVLEPIKIKDTRIKHTKKLGSIIKYLNHHTISWKDCCEHWIKNIMKRVIPWNNGPNYTKRMKFHFGYLVKHWSSRRSAQVEMNIDIEMQSLRIANTHNRFQNYSKPLRS